MLERLKPRPRKGIRNPQQHSSGSMWSIKRQTAKRWRISQWHDEGCCGYESAWSGEMCSKITWSQMQHCCNWEAWQTWGCDENFFAHKILLLQASNLRLINFDIITGTSKRRMGAHWSAWTWTEAHGHTRRCMGVHVGEWPRTPAHKHDIATHGRACCR